MTELQRLHSITPITGTPSGFKARARIYAPNCTTSVLVRIKEVLDLAIVPRPTWPSVSEWRAILPRWFVEACSEEITKEEAERRRLLPISDREKLSERWSVGAWVHWMKPEERQWYWWDATMESSDFIELFLEVSGFPVPAGSLKWLLMASGALASEIDNA